MGAEIVQAADGGRQRLGLDVGQHHLHAGLRKSPPKREPDAAGAAGYECCLAGEFAHDLPAAFEIGRIAISYLHDWAWPDSGFR